jgi:hypothetical protein
MLLSMAVGMLTSSCIVGAERGAPRDAVERGALLVESLTAWTQIIEWERMVATISPEPSTPPPNASNQWMAPHLHWSGVKYVVVEGQWEARNPSYTWGPPTAGAERPGHAPPD